MKKLITLILLLSFTIKAQDVKIGRQIWSTKNLDVSKFRNGEAIPLAKTKAEWALAGKKMQPAWCYYENKTANGSSYGKLYNWYAVNDPRGLAPKGYHIATAAEWTRLTDYFGGEKIAGTKMKSTSGWEDNGNWEDNCNGTNTSGFTALPGGFRFPAGLNFGDGSFPAGLNFGDGSFENIGVQGFWWTSSDYGSDAFASYRNLEPSNGKVFSSLFEKPYGLSVRCIKD